MNELGAIIPAKAAPAMTHERALELSHRYRKGLMVDPEALKEAQAIIARLGKTVATPTAPATPAASAPAAPKPIDIDEILSKVVPDFPAAPMTPTEIWRAANCDAISLARTVDWLDEWSLDEPDQCIRLMRGSQKHFVYAKDEKQAKDARDAWAKSLLTTAAGTMAARAVAELTQADAPKPPEPAAPARAEQFPEFAPQPGSVAWKLLKHFEVVADSVLTKEDVAKVTGCNVASVDGCLNLGVVRGAFKKARNSSMQLTWARGPSDRAVILPGEVTPPTPAPVQPEKIETPAPLPDVATAPSAGALPVATPAPPADLSSACTLQPDLQVSPAPAPPQKSATDRWFERRDLDPMWTGVEPKWFAEHIERGEQFSDDKAVREEWIAFFDKFEIGDYLLIEQEDITALLGWRAFYELQAEDYRNGAPGFVFIKAGEGRVFMVRVL